MRRKLTYLAPIMLLSLLISSNGQTPAHAPAWHVVRTVVLNHQTAPIGSPANPKILFTPSQAGFYRLNLYLSTTGPQGQDGGWLASVTWNEPNGAFVEITKGGYIDKWVLDFQNTVFSPQVGKPVGYFVVTNSDASNSEYTLMISIERLCR